MRWWLALGLGFWMLSTVHAQAPQEPAAPKRYAIEANLKTYPQATPKETLESVLAAIERQRIEYLLAQLTDPEFVDKRVQEVLKGDFEALVRETTAKLADNPAGVKELSQFLKEGEWTADENRATAKLKDRRVFMRKIGKRWYLENRQKPEASKSEP